MGELDKNHKKEVKYHLQDAKKALNSKVSWSILSPMNFLFVILGCLVCPLWLVFKTAMI